MQVEHTRGMLTSIWSEILNIDEIDDADDFFELGGDSLAAARMTTMARRADVPLRAVDVLQYPRFGDLVYVVHCKQHNADL